MGNRLKWRAKGTDPLIFNCDLTGCFKLCSMLFRGHHECLHLLFSENGSIEYVCTLD